MANSPRCYRTPSVVPSTVHTIIVLPTIFQTCTLGQELDQPCVLLRGTRFFTIQQCKASAYLHHVRPRERTGRGCFSSAGSSTTAALVAGESCRSEGACLQTYVKRRTFRTVRCYNTLDSKINIKVEVHGVLECVLRYVYDTSRLIQERTYRWQN